MALCLPTELQKLCKDVMALILRQAFAPLFLQSHLRCTSTSGREHPGTVGVLPLVICMSCMQSIRLSSQGKLAVQAEERSPKSHNIFQMQAHHLQSSV